MANKKISELPDYVGPVNPTGEIPISVAGVTYKIDPDELVDLSVKVDKVPGKGLSTEDYTTIEKNKLAGIALGAEVNVNADWDATSGDAQILNKPSIPSISGLATETFVNAKIEDTIVDGVTTKAPSQNSVFDALAIKVDKVSGKGLSTEDYTSAEKSKLAGIATNAEVNVNADWNATSGDAQILNKPTIPSIVGLATENYVDAKIEDQILDGEVNKAPSQNSVFDALATKVDKVSGKGLSTNDFTDSFKNKLNGIEAGAEVNVNADWGATSGDAFILNKPAIEAPIAAGTTAQYWRGDKTWQTLDKSAVGLGNVDNTSDIDKPISTAVQNALDLKAIDSDVVHITGAETITGNKKFKIDDYNDSVTIENNDFGFGQTIYNNGQGVGQVIYNDSENAVGQEIRAVDPLAGDFNQFYDSSGNKLAHLDNQGNWNAESIIKNGGTSSEFLKADGSVDSTIYETVASASSTYEPTVTAGTTLQYWRGDKTWQNLDKIDVGLTNVDNTSDADKPISNATQNALDLKQDVGDYITGLIGEATATGPGVVNTTLNNAAVTAKVLNGLNITGGTVNATDSILIGIGKLQNQINGLTGGSIFQTTWNASTNTPTITSGVGVKGQYWIVDVAGTTNVDGITDWGVGDWIMFDGTKYIKVDNTDSVTSVNGHTGAVSLVTDDVAEGTSNLYFTEARVAAVNDVALNTASRHNPVTLGTTNGLSLSGQQLSLQAASTSSNGALTSTDWNSFNAKESAINAGTISQYWRGDKTWQTLNKATVGLGNVDNTSDADKPISTTTQTALDGKQNILTNPITGTGTTNYLSKFTGSGTIGNSLIYDNGTNVGIGTTNPLTGGVSAKWLTIDGTTTYGGGFISSINGIAKAYYYTEAGYAKVQGASGEGVSLEINGGTPALRILSSGNVGIGTTSPTARFQVGDLYRVTNDAVTTWGITNGNGILAWDANLAIIGGLANTAVQFRANNQEVMRLTTSGNVGIGTTTPSEKLHVAGNGLFSGSVTATGFFQSSDLNLKNIIKRDGDVAYYTWKDGRDDKEHIGYIAQEVQKNNPNQVNEGADGMLSVNYIELLVQKVSQLEKRIKQLENGK